MQFNFAVVHYFAFLLSDFGKDFLSTEEADIFVPMIAKAACVHGWAIFVVKSCCRIFLFYKVIHNLSNS